MAQVDENLPKIPSYDCKPRRWKKTLRDGMTTYGCYFPSSDLNVAHTGGRGTGIPGDVEWIDPIGDLP